MTDFKGLDEMISDEWRGYRRPKTATELLYRRYNEYFWDKNDAAPKLPNRCHSCEFFQWKPDGIHGFCQAFDITRDAMADACGEFMLSETAESIERVAHVIPYHKPVPDRITDYILRPITHG